jgi:hypothetical protein
MIGFVPGDFAISPLCREMVKRVAAISKEKSFQRNAYWIEQWPGQRFPLAGAAAARGYEVGEHEAT